MHKSAASIKRYSSEAQKVRDAAKLYLHISESCKYDTKSAAMQNIEYENCWSKV